MKNGKRHFHGKDIQILIMKMNGPSYVSVSICKINVKNDEVVGPMKTKEYVVAFNNSEITDDEFNYEGFSAYSPYFSVIKSLSFYDLISSYITYLERTMVNKKWFKYSFSKYEFKEKFET